MNTHLLADSQGSFLWRPNRDRLQVRAEGEQTAVAILHHKLARVPWHVGESSSEFHASDCILGVKRVRVFDEYVRVE